MKSLLYTGQVVIETNWKNKEFDRRSQLRNEQKMEILRSLTVEDCIKIDQNNNPRYDDVELFIFIKHITAVAYHREMQFPVYLKMYLRETGTHDLVIVISFHESGMYD